MHSDISIFFQKLLLKESLRGEQHHDIGFYHKKIAPIYTLILDVTFTDTQYNHRGGLI